MVISPIGDNIPTSGESVSAIGDNISTEWETLSLHFGRQLEENSTYSREEKKESKAKK